MVNLASMRSSGLGEIHGTVLTRAEIGEMLARLCAVSLAERKNTPGLEPGRADVIIGGIVVALAVLDYVDAPSVAISTRGLRYGLLTEIARTCSA
jgi:exopolyphosphatase/guanosine-5'-triphosphate,3'-diphosphate pyrophosphatase